MRNELTEILQNFDVNYIGDLQEYQDIIDATNEKYKGDNLITSDEVNDILTLVADIDYKGQTIPTIHKIIKGKIKSQRRRNKSAMNNSPALKEEIQKPIIINQPAVKEQPLDVTNETQESTPSVHIVLFLILAAYAFGIAVAIALVAAPIVALIVSIQHNLSKNQHTDSQSDTQLEAGTDPVYAQT